MQDFLAKEKELNWLYESSMAEATGSIKEKEETLNRRGEELSSLQEQLVRRSHVTLRHNKSS